MTGRDHRVTRAPLHRGRRRRSVFLGLIATLSSIAAPSLALADELVIENPGEHPDYRLEVGPHGLFGYGTPFTRAEFGAGLLATIIVAKNGFIPTINNSVGISFGAEAFFRTSHTTLLFPVAMQWNFWLSRRWSVFGEPGLAFAANGKDSAVVHGLVMIGGRLHLGDRISLTMRVGTPSFSAGVSFFF